MLGLVVSQPNMALEHNDQCYLFHLPLVLMLWLSVYTHVKCFLQIHSKPPQINPKLPQIHSKSPQVNTKLPQIHSKPPQINTKLPQIHSKSPQINTKLPQIHSKPPQINTKLPQIHSKSPQILKISTNTQNLHK